ncbi:MAG: PmoA family protein, partial [Candidatus Omnitrophica bacterium]|nr:PmoA family protein [Candidatus Omnitrophota bacterium]
MVGLEVEAMDAISWSETKTSIGLKSGDDTVWRFNFEPEASRPYFHPIALEDGTPLTWVRPPDHPWHLGLWFSWKFINGLNYWEEDRETGLSEGRSTVQKVDRELHPDGSARIVVHLNYHAPDLPPVLTEERALQISAPDESGSYRIDWTSTFTAWDESEVLLDRTPLPNEEGGTPWGGYAGLSIRLAKDTSDWVPFNSEGGSGVEGTKARRANWCCYSLKTSTGKDAVVAMFDHP